MQCLTRKGNQLMNIWHGMKIRIFVLRKIVKRTKKIIFSLVFVCFRFTAISYFLNFPSNENVRKQHLSANAYSWINMRYSYTIAVCKDEIFRHFVTKCFTCVYVNFSLTIFKRKDEICYFVLQLKQAIGQLSLKIFTFFLLIFCRKGHRRVEDLFFFLFHRCKC